MKAYYVEELKYNEWVNATVFNYRNAYYESGSSNESVVLKDRKQAEQIMDDCLNSGTHGHMRIVEVYLN